MSSTENSKSLGGVRRFLEDASSELPGPDAPLGQIAASRGWITEAQLEEALAEQPKTEPRELLGQILLRRRFLTNEQLLRALACQKKAPPPPQLPDGAKIGRYALIREIGRGGMGVVYEAEDPDLRRRVALKVLRDPGADATAAERLRREAAIAAQLRHPGIITVHEVGTTSPDAGPPMPFIAMDFVEGRTLAALLHEKKTDRKTLLRILEEISRAVAHAHEQGVVHRDLKPANVLVDKNGRAVLGDFGIARAESFQTRLTETRFMMGTPEYMAPEQADGGVSGPPGDIHALGVILYEILTGRLPYRAETPVALLRKIALEEPEGPRKLDPTVTADLEVVCLKALEKEGKRRYATAAAFANDLARIRTGQPIEARPAGRVTKLWRALARRKAPLLVGVAAILAALAATLMAALWAGRERAQAIAQLKDRIETTMRAALELRRAGDLPRMKLFAQEALEACAAASERYPGLAEPHALKGRMHRLLMDFEPALQEQERALALDPDCSRALYERIVLGSRLLRARGDALVEAAWRSLGEKLVKERSGRVRAEDVVVPTRDRLARQDPAASALRARLEDDLARLEAPDAELACARALARGSRPTLDPAREESIEALASFEEDAGRFEPAIAVWSKGIESDRGYLPFLDGRGESRLREGYRKLQRGEDPAELFIAAIGDFGAAAAKDPQRDASLRNRGVGQYLLGLSIGWGRVDDAMRQFHAAAEDLGRAIELKPTSGPAWMWRGVVRISLSVGTLIRLGDPLPLCGDAVRDLSEAIRLDPAADEPLLWRAIARIPWGFQIALRGEDPEPLYREAMGDFERALSLNPGRGETWLWRASTRLSWAAYRMGHGRETLDLYRKAAADLDVAVQKLPSSVEAAEKRGLVELALADMPGEDAAAHAREALRCYEIALARNRGAAGALAGRGAALARLGRFDDAFRDLDAAVKLEPAARVARGEARVRRGLSRGDGDADFLEAIVDLKKAIETNPLSPDAWIWLGRARTLAAASRPVPILHYAEAVGDFGKVLLFAPDHPLALRFRADALQRRAALKASRRLDAAPDWRAALDDLEHLLRLSPAWEPELRAAKAACAAALR